MKTNTPIVHDLEDALRAAGVPGESIEDLPARLEGDWRPPADVLERLDGVPPAAVCEAVARYLGVETRSSLKDAVAPEAFLERVPADYARRMGVAALTMDGDHTLLAVAPQPDAGALVAEISAALESPCRVVIAPRTEVEGVIDRSVRQRPEYLATTADELGKPEGELTESARRLEKVTDFGRLMRKTPVVKMVSLLVAQAVRTGSSDIHFQPLGDVLRVRFRTDGILHDIIDLPRSAQDAILTRVKVLGNMDIAERRAPQDGRASFRYADRDIDVRMSVVPVDNGERAVLRLFDKEARRLDLDEVGMASADQARFEELLRASHGMILVTGPTGSGKTTTLHSALLKINTPEMNMITIEDPVEYKLPGISQIQVQAKKNVTFASMLRYVVRQDPDIIMVGEIRDAETAAMAIQSALTGHLVLSTLHTNDAAGAITRMLDFDIEPFRLSSALLASMAQRLVRRVCRHCAEAVSAQEARLELLALPPSAMAEAAPRRGKGCEACFGTGYLGRVGIFEMLAVTDAVAGLINHRAPWADVRNQGLADGMRLLRRDGAEKVLRGVTTTDEVLRVTQRER